MSTFLEGLGLLFKKLAGLINVKSLVTIALTVAFIVQTCRGALDKEMMTIYSMVMTFYFMNQTGKPTGGSGDGDGR